MTGGQGKHGAPSGTAEQLADDVLRQATLDVRTAARALRARRDPERTHKLRVAVRKLRVALKLFAPLLDRARADPVVEDLRWLFRALGPVREYDVLLEAVAPLEVEPALLRSLKQRRQRAERAAQRALSGARFRGLVRSLRGVASAPRGEQAHPAKKWARKRLAKRLAGVLALRARAEQDQEARHELRKQVKKLRYAADLLGPLWPSKRVKRYLEPLERLQDVLGELNDARVAEHLLHEAAAPLGGGAAREAERLQTHVTGNTRGLQAQFERRLRALARADRFWVKR